jgi:hypothetical protein
VQTSVENMATLEEDEILSEMLRRCGDLKRALHRRRHEQQRRWTSLQHTTQDPNGSAVAVASLAERFLKLSQEVLTVLDEDGAWEGVSEMDADEASSSAPKRRCCAP